MGDFATQRIHVQSWIQKTEENLVLKRCTFGDWGILLILFHNKAMFLEHICLVGFSDEDIPVVRMVTEKDNGVVIPHFLPQPSNITVCDILQLCLRILGLVGWVVSMGY